MHPRRDAPFFQSEVVDGRWRIHAPAQKRSKSPPPSVNIIHTPPVKSLHQLHLEIHRYPGLAEISMVWYIIQIRVYRMHTANRI